MPFVSWARSSAAGLALIGSALTLAQPDPRLDKLVSLESEHIRLGDAVDKVAGDVGVKVIVPDTPKVRWMAVRFNAVSARDSLRALASVNDLSLVADGEGYRLMAKGAAIDDTRAANRKALEAFLLKTLNVGNKSMSQFAEEVRTKLQSMEAIKKTKAEGWAEQAAKIADDVASDLRIAKNPAFFALVQLIHLEPAARRQLLNHEIVEAGTHDGKFRLPDSYRADLGELKLLNTEVPNALRLVARFDAEEGRLRATLSTPAGPDGNEGANWVLDENFRPPEIIQPLPHFENTALTSRINKTDWLTIDEAAFWLAKTQNWNFVSVSNRLVCEHPHPSRLFSSDLFERILGNAGDKVSFESKIWKFQGHLALADSEEALKTLDATPEPGLWDYADAAAKMPVQARELFENRIRLALDKPVQPFQSAFLALRFLGTLTTSQRELVNRREPLALETLSPIQAEAFRAAFNQGLFTRTPDAADFMRKLAGEKLAFILDDYSEYLEMSRSDLSRQSLSDAAIEQLFRANATYVKNDKLLRRIRHVDLRFGATYKLSIGYDFTLNMSPESGTPVTPTAPGRPSLPPSNY